MRVMALDPWPLVTENRYCFGSDFVSTGKLPGGGAVYSAAFGEEVPGARAPTICTDPYGFSFDSLWHLRKGAPKIRCHGYVDPSGLRKHSQGLVLWKGWDGNSIQIARGFWQASSIFTLIQWSLVRHWSSAASCDVLGLLGTCPRCRTNQDNRQGVLHGRYPFAPL